MGSRIRKLFLLGIVLTLVYLAATPLPAAAGDPSPRVADGDLELELDREPVLELGSRRNRMGVVAPGLTFEVDIRFAGPAPQLAQRGIDVLQTNGNLIVARGTIGQFVQLLEVYPDITVERRHYAEPEVVSEGVSVVGADDWHAAGYLGAGLKVAIVDGGFAGYTALLGSELPGTVVVQSFRPDGAIERTTHGTAVAEIVHDIVPAAQLFLIVSGGESRMDDVVDFLIANGIDVVNMSSGYLLGPFDGTGPVITQVERAVDNGIAWFNSAGNYAASHWGGTYTDTDGDDWHEYAPGVELNAFLIAAGSTFRVYLTWQTGDTNMEGCLFELVGGTPDLRDCTDTPQQPGDRPVEFLEWENTSSEDVAYAVAVGRVSGPAQRLDVFVPNAILNHPVPETSVNIPALSPKVISIGAVDWQTPADLEWYSSQGPTLDGRTKPDYVAPTGVTTAIMAPDPFAGTSGAAPHATGVGALLLDADPGLTVAELRDQLTDNAIRTPPGSSQNNQFGWGLIKAGPVPAVSGISGKVTHSGGTPAAGACVTAYDSSLIPAGDATTTGGGHYSMDLSPATYYVEFSDCGAGTYQTEWYDDQPSAATATPVTVDPGSVTTDIDADLVAIDTPPATTIHDPAHGSTVSGTTPIAINATDAEDAVGSLTVQWNIDGGAWQSATYNAGNGDYESSWDTTTVIDGSHVINARATDSAAGVGSDAATVTVQNAPVTAKCNGLVATKVGTPGDDLLVGTAGADVIAALGGNDEVRGLGGNDTICGGAGKDVLYGGAGADVIFGNNGNDTILGGFGDDDLRGGAGIDTASYATASRAVTVNLGTGTATGEGTDTLVGFQNAIGSPHGDVLIGNARGNLLDGRAGDDELIGKGGKDTLQGKNGNDLMDGGGSGDTMLGGSGDDAMDGAKGPDFMYGNGGRDLLGGNLGDDYVVGGAGSDRLAGEGGDDIVVGGTGGDRVFGGRGDDLVAGEGGNDRLVGGPGWDAASWQFASTPITASLTTGMATGEGNDTLVGIEALVGSAHADLLTGNNADNTILGLEGADTLIGRGGNDGFLGGDHDDSINANAGDDYLDGEAGFDTLNGGTGSDYCINGEAHSSCESPAAVAERAGSHPDAVEIVLDLMARRSDLLRQTTPLLR